MKKLLRFTVLGIALVSLFSCRDKIDVGGSDVVFTREVEGVTFNSAKLIGSVSPLYADAISEVGFIYAKSGKLKTGSSPREVSGLSENKFWVTLSGLQSETAYDYRAYAVKDGKEEYGELRSFTTRWDVPENAVDMGTGVYWAKWNLGATSESDVGDYYSWGETEPNPPYTEENYVFYNGEFLRMSKYNDTDGLTFLQPSDDAATQKWQKHWRIPTEEDFQKLIDNCSSVKATVGSVKGVKFTAKNGNTLFIPCSGYLENDSDMCSVGMVHAWTSSVAGPGYGWLSKVFYFNYDCTSSTLTGVGIRSFGRTLGFPIRPVSD